MTQGRVRFDRFTLDPDERRLLRDGEPVELNARYLDALALLARHPGQLVTKDRFLEQVWHGVPVTDEALTQCIRALRRVLGDDAARPRFIETVPKHGYRFIVPVEPDEHAQAASGTSGQEFALLGAAGALGAGAAGILGGLFYGFASTAQPLQPGTGALSMLAVLLAITVVLALVGGAGVAFGIAAASAWRPGQRWLRIVGGALGGLVVGAGVKLVGTDAFDLLLGQSPGDITGAGEGVVLGAAVGMGSWLAATHRRSLAHAVASAAAIGALAGLSLALLGGRLMGGSLALLASRFPASRLRLDAIGAVFGETGFGPISHAVTAALEGGLFSACIVAAMLAAERWKTTTSTS
ncbi:winged helix-turn-helix domain-containing protein [Sphingomonas japonica]|uniref:DNA-binding winged helix-turn-helix (WHTH) protein n=2 Tax=Sphingomonas japonica TaxID=511662 RepID=A0ABX0TZK8_9SPHN|nr:transcriptional regulator [Sphingomonas japonica]NIJ23753.1 DNA-binding winged helix-turn-helix (wHTH) protein [Sphingomonas japonica]